MQIINAVNKAIIDNGLNSINVLITFFGISYASAVAILKCNGKASLADIMLILNFVGLTLNHEGVVCNESN